MNNLRLIASGRTQESNWRNLYQKGFLVKQILIQLGYEIKF